MEEYAPSRPWQATVALDGKSRGVFSSASFISAASRESPRTALSWRERLTSKSVENSTFVYAASSSSLPWVTRLTMSLSLVRSDTGSPFARLYSATSPTSSIRLSKRALIPSSISSMRSLISLRSIKKQSFHVSLYFAGLLTAGQPFQIIRSSTAIAAAASTAGSALGTMHGS